MAVARSADPAAWPICELLRDRGHAAGRRHQRGARAGADVQHRGGGEVHQRHARRRSGRRSRRALTPRSPADACPHKTNRFSSGASNLEELAGARRRRLSAPVRPAATRSASWWRRTEPGAHDELEAERPETIDQRPHPGDPVVRQGELPRAVRRPRDDPGLHPAGRAAGARLPDLQAARFRRLGRRRGPAVPDEDQRADDLGVAAAVPGQVPAAAAGEVARADRRRDPLPPALPRPHRQSRLAPRVRDAQPRRRGDPRVHDRARVPRGRDADDAADRRRRAGAAVRDASQRARHGPVPAHRARAVSEAADRRRPRAGLRDQPQLPERGDLDAAQPRVHDAGVLPGLRRLPGPDGDDRGAARDGGARRRSAPTRSRSASIRSRWRRRSRALSLREARARGGVARGCGAR